MDTSEPRYVGSYYQSLHPECPLWVESGRSALKIVTDRMGDSWCTKYSYRTARVRHSTFPRRVTPRIEWHALCTISKWPCRFLRSKISFADRPKCGVKCVVLHGYTADLATVAAQEQLCRSHARCVARSCSIRSILP